MEFLNSSNCLLKSFSIRLLYRFDNRSLEKAIELVKREHSDIEAITQLGEGWVGEEAIAISEYCALKYQNDFKKALISAVNHIGDSDSLMSILYSIVYQYF
ncbi:ADP-ribosylglycohydrolase family protein [Gottfriedia acidiceleris]|uniref:ADP-ribosylglycohydrolase family protein n=1 Tax=Gottfriedia acidiceleris TaxID=371036 RepID=A0ABY4JFB2_9BACI|nr:ADP-ribosylglycohydrolase family protein [Gottfriedia acidiceleris]UPM52530.1 ADP-ribosylglycohydrolase family protein [Gottfriedia acidiceleris]